jgi:hypothetical protein
MSTACTKHTAGQIGERPNFLNLPIFNAKVDKGEMAPHNLCPSFYYYLIKFGWATINIKGTRGKNVFFAVIDLVT